VGQTPPSARDPLVPLATISTNSTPHPESHRRRFFDLLRRHHLRHRHLPRLLKQKR
jgi:hypothetical protein